MLMKYKTFYEVIIEPNAGDDLSQTVQEMSALSKTIEMPVCAKFNGYNLRVEPDSDPVKVANEYFSAKCKRR